MVSRPEISLELHCNKSLLSFISNLQVSTKFHPTSQDIVCILSQANFVLTLASDLKRKTFTIFPLDIGNQSTKNDNWASNTSSVVTISFSTTCGRAQCASQ